MCEQMDYINTVTVPRLQKVIDGEQGGISKLSTGKAEAHCLLRTNGTKRIHCLALQAADTSEEVQAILNRVTDDASLFLLCCPTIYAPIWTSLPRCL